VCFISLWRQILVTGHRRFVTNARRRADGRTDRCTLVDFNNALPEWPRDAMKLLNKANLPMTSVNEWLCKWNYYRSTRRYRPGNRLFDISICLIKFSMVSGCHWAFLSGTVNKTDYTWKNKYADRLTETKWKTRTFQGNSELINLPSTTTTPPPAPSLPPAVNLVLLFSSFRSTGLQRSCEKQYNASLWSSGKWKHKTRLCLTERDLRIRSSLNWNCGSKRWSECV
jgi:hypothetical protein